MFKLLQLTIHCLISKHYTKQTFRSILSKNWIISGRTSYHCARGLVEGYANLAQEAGTESVNRADCRLSISEEMVNSPFGQINPH